MTKRTYILVCILGISFVGMILYLNSRKGLSSGELIVSLMFGTVLVTVPIVLAKVSPNNLPGIPQSGFLRHYLVGLAIVFAIWMLVSIILLPFYGVIGFELLGKPLFGIIWAVLGLAATPIARKFIL